MKKIICMVLILLTLVGCTNTGAKDISPEVEKSISDLDILIDKAERIHPDLYKYTSEEAFDKQVTEIKSRFETGDSVEFYTLVAPLFASLNDGVTTLEPLGEYFNNAIANGQHFFPFQIEIQNQGLFLESSFIGETALTEGTQVVAINGVDFEMLYEEMIAYSSGVTMPSRESYLTKEFHRLYYVLYGDSKTFTLKYMDGDEIKEIEIEGANKDNIVVQPLPEVKTHRYEVLEEGVGVMTIYKFDGFSTFKRFMEATIKKMENEPVDTLVIDLRDNIGGNAEYAKYLMSYLTDKPFRVHGEIAAKISDEVLSKDNYMKENYSENVGEVITAAFNEESRPYEEVVPFDGDVYVLIDQQTFGTASEFAAMVKDYSVATLVGQETGTNPSNFKSVYLTTAPSLNMNLVIPYQYFARPSGEDLQKGVLPDVMSDDALQYVLDNH